MGKTLDAFLGKGFKSSKCIALLKMTVSRIKLLKNKREIQCRQYKKDTTMLLQKGQEASASSRVEHVFKEQNILDAYSLIEGFCYLVTQRMVAIEKQKTCPNDLKEAIASLIFAAPRCADLPELQEVRSIFSAKYGHEFSTAAVELHPESGVNRQIIEKLSTRPPSTDIKLWLLKEIAAENGIDWDFEKAEKELLKPSEDLLDGPQPSVGIQVNQKPSDGSRKGSMSTNTMGHIESNESFSSRNMSQPVSVSQSPPVLPLSTSPGHKSVNEQKKVPRARQGHARLRDPEKYDSTPLNASHFPIKEEPVKSTRLAGTVNSKISEDPYIKLRKEGKMDYHAGGVTTHPISASHFPIKEEPVESTRLAGTVNSKISEDPYITLRKEGKMDYHAGGVTTHPISSYQKFPSPGDVYHSSAKLSKNDEVSFNFTQDKIHYKDAAMAAEAAFQSAAYAAEAAKAAINLAKCEPSDNESTQAEENWREAGLEGELDEALEAALAQSVRIFESDCEDNSFAKTEKASRKKSSRTRKHAENYVSCPDPGFARVHLSQKDGANRNGEETSEAPVSLSRKEKYPAYKYAEQNLKDYNNNAEENKFKAYPSNEKHVKKECFEGNEIQSKSKKSMSRSASSSSKKSSSSKPSQPVFDNYDGDEYGHIYSDSNRHKSTLNADIRYENNASHMLRASDTSSGPKFDQGGQYEMITSRRQREKQRDNCQIGMQSERPRSEMRPKPGKGLEAEGEVKTPSYKSKTRSSKPSFKDFVQQETQSFEVVNPQSTDAAGSLNDFERMKFQYQKKAPYVKSSYPEDSVHRDKGFGKTLQDYGSIKDQHNFVEDTKPWDGCYSALPGIREDNLASDCLATRERPHLGAERSVEVANDHDIQSSNKPRHRKANDLQPKYDNDGHNKDDESSINRVRHHKATHRGESQRSVRTKQHSRGLQTLRNKEEERNSTDMRYANLDNPSSISPASLHSYKKSSHATTVRDSMHDSSSFTMPPTPFSQSGTDTEQTLNSSSIKPPYENVHSNPSRTCTDEEFSERLAALRRKR